MRHGTKIFLSLLLIICTMALSCIPVHAAPVALTAAEELCALWAMYTETVGFSPLYSTNNTLNNFSNPFSASTAANNIADLYQRYCTYSGRIETIQETVTWIKTNTELAISNQQTGAFQYAAGVTEFFDKFSTWVLDEVVGVVKDSITGLFSTKGTWFNNTLSYVSTVNGKFDYGTYPALNNVATWNANNAVVGTKDGHIIKFGVSNITNYSGPLYAFCYTDNYNSNHFVLIYDTTYGSLNANSNVRFRDSSLSNYGNFDFSSQLLLNTSYRYHDHNGIPITTMSSSDIVLPFYDSLSDGLSNFGAVGETERIQLRPKDKYNEDALDIPDVSSPDYVGTRVLEGVTSVPWTDSLTLDDILERVLSLSLANENVLEDENVAPDPVINPLVPFDLPSFEFNFSGIWHYVVSWIGSLRSGFSFIASTWAALPYAMVIPIYASAVVVIVIGTFKRFFS